MADNEIYFRSKNLFSRDVKRIQFIFSIIIVLIISIIIFLNNEKLLQDPDNWWHIKVGLDMLSNKSFPNVDIYSYTFAGSPWIAKEWLGQILLTIAYKSGGWNGVVILVVCTIALTIFLISWNLSNFFKPTTTLIITTVIASLISMIFTARPLIFTLPIIVVWTFELFKSAYEEKTPSFKLLILIWLWANLHATFTFGYVIAAFAGFDYLIRMHRSRSAQFWRGIQYWLAFGVASFLVTQLNPYGFKAVLMTFTVSSGNEAVPYINEWRPFNARGEPYVEIILLITAFSVMYFRPKMSFVKILFSIFFLHLLFIHMRFAALFFLLVPLVLAPEIEQQFQTISVRTWASAQRDKVERFFARSFYSVSFVITSLFAATLVIFALTSQSEPSPEISAKEALAFVGRNNITGNVFNSYNYGGVLIFHGIKTYIDGRAEQLFLGGFTKNDMKIRTSKGKSELIKQLKNYNITWALLTADDESVPFFEELPDWQLAYSDKYSFVFTRKN